MKIRYFNGLNEKLNNLIKTNYPELLNEKNPDIIISNGGDGSVIRTFNKLIKSNIKQNVPIFVVATGSINFLSNNIKNKYDFLDLIDLIKNNKIEIFKYNFNPLVIEHENKSYLAINDILLGNNINDYQRFKLYTKDISLNNLEFSGMGLNISTDIGSTGFHLNNNGQIFFDKNLMGITNIVSNININEVIPNQNIVIENLSERSSLNIFIDGSNKILSFKKYDNIKISRGKMQYSLGFLEFNQLNNKKLEYLNQNRKKHLN